MRTLRRNERYLWYCLYKGESELIDENGNRTGEKAVLYEQPVKIRANVSPATGLSNTEQFGNLENYDKVIVLCDMKCPIDENSVLFVDKEPETTEVKSYAVVESQALFGDDTVEETVLVMPKHDYIVRRIAKSINGVSIAVRKVTVS